MQLQNRRLAISRLFNVILNEMRGFKFVGTLKVTFVKAGRSSWRICRHAIHLFDLQEQLSCLNVVKKNHRFAPVVGTLP